MGLQGAGGVLWRARGHRLAGQQAGWLTVSHKGMPQGLRGCGYSIEPPTEAADLGRPPCLTRSKDILVFQPSRAQQRSLSQGSSSMGLWGCQSGGKCSPGILGFTCHFDKGWQLEDASGEDHCL